MNPTVLLRALGHRNFRLYFLGQGVSLIGTWMQQVALAWLVFQMTGSPIWLGVVAFAGQIPTFFLAPVAGVLADRPVLQTIVDEDKRGRVMSFYTMAFMGTAPLGSLLGGVLADAVGAGGAIALAGALLGAGACVFAVTLPALRERVQPIYRRLGILPEVAAGLQSAAQLTVPPEGR